MTNKQLLENLGIDTKRITTSGKTTCPKCSATRKNKTDPCLSVDVITGVYNCHNNCGFSGGVANTYKEKPKEYVVPEFINRTELSKKAVDYFFTRGISQQTLIDCKITTGKNYMPQFSKEVETINFNYFRNGELVNIKYRGVKKSFKMVKDAELIFYGLDDIKDSDWCVIVEGEVDKLSFWEAGVKEVVSVPNGASKSSNAYLEYLDNCIEYFENKTKIILAMDNDEVGISLRDEIARRLGLERCFKVKWGDYKDANDFLKGEDAEKLKLVIEQQNLKEFPISGIITANDLWDGVESFFKTGVERGQTTGRMEEFDELVSFSQSQLMVLTGIPNHGKSPFALMIMVCLSLRYGWKWAIVSPEHNPLTMYLTKFCEIILGKRIRKGVGFTDEEKKLVKQFINDHFYFIQPEDDDMTVDNILEKAKMVVKQKGVKGLLIDPWNKLEHNMGANEHQYISKELDKIIRFNQRHAVFTIIVVHPVKMKKDPKTKLFEVPSLYDIAGSSNWYNKPDIGVIFYRNFKTGNSEIHVEKIKYEHLGKQGMAEMRYNMNNGRFAGKTGEWDNSNWLLNVIQTDIFEQEVPIYITTEVDDNEIF